MKRRALLPAAPGLALAPWTSVRADGFPEKTVRYIVPVAPGGGGDMIGKAQNLHIEG